MTSLAGLQDVSRRPSRRHRAGRTSEAALRGGLLCAAVATAAWLAAAVIAATAFTILLVATLATVLYAFVRGRVTPMVWLALAAGWGVVLLERWVVGGHGGVWVAVAAWLGVIVGARRAGISRWATGLLAYPLIAVAIALADQQPLLSPWGSSWIWVPAVLGPALAARTLLRSRRAQVPWPGTARDVS